PCPVPAHEADGVLHQYWPRNDDEARRPGQGAGGGRDRGCGVGVYEQEPLPPDHPLWTLPNVLLTPHIAGHGPYLNDRRFQIMVDNCRAFAAGRALRNVVDKSSWF